MERLTKWDGKRYVLVSDDINISKLIQQLGSLENAFEVCNINDVFEIKELYDYKDKYYKENQLSNTLRKMLNDDIRTLIAEEDVKLRDDLRYLENEVIPQMNERFLKLENAINLVTTKKVDFDIFINCATKEKDLKTAAETYNSSMEYMYRNVSKTYFLSEEEFKNINEVFFLNKK